MEYIEATTNIGQPRVIIARLDDLNGRQESVTLPLSDLKQVWVHRPEIMQQHPALSYGVYVEHQYYRGDPGYSAWAVRYGGSDRECFNRLGEWEEEPQPSDRDNAFYNRCRWSDFGEAMTAAQKAVEKAKGGE